MVMHRHLGQVELLKLVEKQTFVKKAQQIKEVLKDVRMGRCDYSRILTSSRTMKLVSECNGERVLTLVQRESRNLLRIAEGMSGNSSNDDKQCIPDRLKEEIHQVNLAMKLVSSPLHHTQDTGGPLSKEEEQMRRVEDHLKVVAMHKMPRGLKSLLKDKLISRLGLHWTILYMHWYRT